MLLGKAGEPHDTVWERHERQDRWTDRGDTETEERKGKSFREEAKGTRIRRAS